MFKHWKRFRRNKKLDGFENNNKTQRNYEKGVVQVPRFFKTQLRDPEMLDVL